MDDIFVIRCKNLQLICELECAGNQSELARSLDYANPSIVNRYLHGKPIGEDVARLVEQKLGYPRGWMDNVHPSERAQRVAHAFLNAAVQIQEAIESVLKLPPLDSTRPSIAKDRRNKSRKNPSATLGRFASSSTSASEKKKIRPVT